MGHFCLNLLFKEFTFQRLPPQFRNHHSTRLGPQNNQNLSFWDQTLKLILRGLRIAGWSHTSCRSLPEEVLDDLSFHIVAWFLSHHGTELAEFAQQAVLVLGITPGCRQAGLLGRVCRGIFWILWLGCIKHIISCFFNNTEPMWKLPLPGKLGTIPVRWQSLRAKIYDFYKNLPTVFTLHITTEFPRS